jgi:hypothetical protein
LVLRCVAPLLLAGWLLACSGTSSPRAAVDAPVAACNRYAGPGGHDRGPGTADRPFRTVQRLANALRPGEVGCLHAGTYRREIDGPYVLRLAHGGAPGAPITIRSAPGERAKLRGIVFVPHGADHVTLSGLRLDGRRPRAGEAPVSVQIMARDTTLEDSDVTNHGVRSCVLLGSNGRWGGARATVISGNRFHGCGSRAHGMLDHAIYIAESHGARVIDNAFVHNAGWAVQLFPNAHGTLISGNVMWDNGGGVVFASDGGTTSTGNVVEHNLIGASRSRAELTSSWGGPVGRGNVARGNCLVPGLAPWDQVRGFRVSGNRVVRADGGAGCAGTVPPIAAALADPIAPATLRRVLAR